MALVADSGNSVGISLREAEMRTFLLYWFNIVGWFDRLLWGRDVNDD